MSFLAGARNDENQGARHSAGFLWDFNLDIRKHGFETPNKTLRLSVFA